MRSTRMSLNGACNHESRLHRREDLARYFLVSSYGVAHCESPKLRDFPENLLPDHENAIKARETRELFDDRLRVQLAHKDPKPSLSRSASGVAALVPNRRQKDARQIG